VVLTGNPVIDALQQIIDRPTPPEARAILERFHIGPGGRQLALVTAHRRENFGEPFEGICQGLRRLAQAYPERLQLVYPVHLNPNVQEPVYRLLSDMPNITLLPPLDYLPLVHLMRHARLVLTDSGGIQEEATSLGVPTLVLRQVTERPEGVEAGVLQLVGSDPQRIFEAASRLMDDPMAYHAMATAQSPFGDGHAAERIVAALQNYVEH
jgi:UDP-N-acetylglucosamine 2-epimerase (non-hydrolysing)